MLKPMKIWTGAIAAFGMEARGYFEWCWGDRMGRMWQIDRMGNQWTELWPAWVSSPHMRHLQTCPWPWLWMYIPYHLPLVCLMVMTITSPMPLLNAVPFIGALGDLCLFLSLYKATGDSGGSFRSPNLHGHLYVVCEVNRSLMSLHLLMPPGS